MLRLSGNNPKTVRNPRVPAVDIGQQISNTPMEQQHSVFEDSRNQPQSQNIYPDTNLKISAKDKLHMFSGLRVHLTAKHHECDEIAKAFDDLKYITRLYKIDNQHLQSEEHLEEDICSIKHTDSRPKPCDCKMRINSSRNAYQMGYGSQKERISVTNVIDMSDNLNTMYGKLELLKSKLSCIIHERESHNLKLINTERDIHILEQQREKLQKIVNEYRKRTETIQNEMQQLFSHKEELKHELEEQVLEQDVFVKDCQVQDCIDFIELASHGYPVNESATASRKCTPTSKQLEFQFLEEKHKEELQLCKQQLAQAVQQICFLDQQLKGSSLERWPFVNQNKSAVQKHKCLSRENSNLVDDGSPHDRPDLLDLTNDEYTNNVCYPIPMSNNSNEDRKNGARFEANLISFMTKKFDTLEQQLISLIGKEVKRHTYDLHHRFATLENNIQELIHLTKSHTETNAVDDVKECNGGREYQMDTSLGKEVPVETSLEDMKKYAAYNMEIKPPYKMNCGIGMAFSFLYGYLKFVLPPGIKISSKGMEQRILDYIHHHHLKDHAFPLRKLFILIPDDGCTRPSLKALSIDDPSDGRPNMYWMDPAGHLEVEVIVRDGVKRPYHHSVYTIKDPDRKDGSYDYVVAEFATPLKIFYGLQTCRNPRISEAFRINQQKVVSLFYSSLMERLRKNKDCEKLCEVIYYHSTKNGKRVNIGRVISDRIQLRKREDKSILGIRK